MKKRAAIAVGIVLTVTLLGGCAASGEPGNDPEATSAPASPLTAESPAPTSDDAAPGTEAAFLSMIREGTEAAEDSQVSDATDEQFLAAGTTACEQVAAGTDVFDVRVVDGEQPTAVGYSDSVRITAAALEHLCPDLSVD